MSMGVKEDKQNTPKKPFIYYYTITVSYTHLDVYKRQVKYWEM